MYKLLISSSFLIFFWKFARVFVMIFARIFKSVLNRGPVWRLPDPPLLAWLHTATKMKIAGIMGIIPA